MFEDIYIYIYIYPELKIIQCMHVSQHIALHEYALFYIFIIS
jgi:hypothetical protein